MGRVVIEPHVIASDYWHKIGLTDVVDQRREPHDPEGVPVESPDQVSVDEKLLEPTVQVVEVEVLVGRGAGVVDGPLRMVEKVLCRSR